MKVKHLLIIIMAVLAVGLLIWYFAGNDEDILPNITRNNQTAKVISGPDKDPFKMPVGVFVDDNGRIYVADANNHRIRIFTSAGKLIRQFGQYGSDQGKMGYPVAVAVNSLGEVFVSEIINNRVQVFSDQGVFIRRFPADKADLKQPSALFIGHNDRVYVFDRGDQRVKLFDKSGRLLRVFGGGTGPGERLRYAMGLAEMQDGSLVVADSENRSVKIFDQRGRLKEQLLRNTNGIPALGLPRGLAVIGDNKLAVVDGLSRKVYLLSREGQGWKSIVLKHEFMLPDGAFYSKEKLYVTDRSSNNLVVFDNIR